MSSSQSSSSSSSKPPQHPDTSFHNEALVKVIVGGMVLTSAGFAMYTRRTGQLLKQMEHASKSKAKRMPPPKIGPMTQSEWDKVRPRIDKDDFF
mmetsp:Transcript_35159/g.85157  ORF Transcript_35159/g.85157 Transcript_35159/m.85157 type:complete len:94 (+) Transcript_35159:227-508(+)|eukprot:CAMPEP_0113632844 /NCGR_PEP_ID=MMETSP0017_2-20120614/17081_1 /TAXON_ID=2856 /ORGANISM="Cylindrotheca closterium" /LENGTH=93 /DNA_ID=CAMNT_0000543435 /DNA_START=168 /DNA_END=449 /DNA_ORIENTATION=- /assembly_acc=CAM_ASM_000147